MNATFTGINIASRGLYASQAGLAVTTDNVSNANTEGYSRQTVTQSAVTPAAVYSSNAVLGNGVEVTAIDQARDAFLDQRYWKENSRLGEWATKSETLTEIESVMNNTTDSAGFSTIFDDFYTALETLTTNPSDSATRAEVQEYGAAICQYLNETSARLTEIQADLNTTVKTTVDEINSYAEQIAALNQRIDAVLATGGNANTLKDQRALLVDSLTELVACDVTATDDSLTIQIGGSTLVDGERCNSLMVTADSANSDYYAVQWAATGSAAVITGGTLKAELDLRDGDGTDAGYKGVNYYLDQLDTFAQTFAKAFNEGVLADTSVTTYEATGHADGYTADGATGVRFFTYDDLSSATLTADIAASGLDAAYAKITAANLSLSAEVAADVDNIAASSSADEAENSEIASGLIDMLEDTAMFSKGAPGDFYNAIISTLATDSSAAERRNESYSSIVNQLSDRRTSVSGVDTNEETAYMTQYQAAYEASAQMVSVWSDVLAVTINMADND